jgi:hypothetical protein
MENDGLGALTVADFGGTISHITQDGRATGGNGYSRLYDFSNTNPSVAVTWTVSDLLAGYKADDTLVDCSTAGNVTDTIGNAYSLKTDTASEGGGAFSANCSSSGTLTRVAQISWNNRDAFDYGLRVGSPEYTAGVGGTAIGSRVFRFNRDRITLPWASAIVYDNDMPVNFSTGTSNVDTDGDGVIDLFDNCDTAFNPSQDDPDADGKGCVCDSGETCS